MRAVLGNVEELKRDYPGFEVPPVEHREDLRPGDLAELMFLTDRYPESIWAEVEDVPGPGWYRGVLETGEPIEFGPEHVSDIKVPPPQMGADRPSVFDFFHPGREPKPGRRPSIWNWEEHAAWVDAERARKAAEAAGRPKRSFWDWLRRKPKYEMAPIPEPERRPARGMLPGPVEIFEEAPKPAPRPRPEAPPPPAAPTIIVPSAPPPMRPIEVPETIIEHGAPVSFFDVLGPGPAAPPAAAPPPGGLILAPEPPPPAPAVPGGLIVAPEQPMADVFNVLGPGPVAPASGLIVPEVRATLPAETNVFNVLAPEAPGGMVRHEVTPFDVLAPEAPSRGMVQQEVTPFDVIAAPPGGPVTPFDVLAPEPSSGLVVHEPPGVFDVLAPQEQGLAPYVEPGAVSPFEVFAQPELFPPPPGAAVVEPPIEEAAPKKKRKKKANRFGDMDWLTWVRDTFNLEELRVGIQANLEDPWYLERKADEELSGMWATIPILTWENGNWYEMARELGIDEKDFEPYLKKMDEEAEEHGWYEEGYEKFQLEVIEPISEALNKAFKQLLPDLRGSFFLGDDGSTEGQTYGIVYYEELSEAEKKRLQRELEYKHAQEKKESAARAQRIEDEKKRRKQELRQIWGRMPTVDEVAPWVDQVYSQEFWRNLKKNRNSKGFQAELENAAGQGEAGVMEIEAIADEGPHLYEQLASYFGIPPDIFQVYLGGVRPDQEEAAESLLWNEVLRPYFEVVAEALNREKPKGLPGELVYEWDDDDQQFFLKYIESWEE